ncbi:MAG: Rid family hydrolase [Bryobacteraceae bacterium]|nr:Rid family hydrolase [Bryobacteraceae bacterium]
MLATVALLLAADVRVVTPANGAKPVGPYSPGIVVGDYLYVSGQGAAGAVGIEAQTRLCLNNVRAIVEGAGFQMDQVVYAQLYLADIGNYNAVNKIWPEYFKTPPARATLAVTRMPTDTPIEITVVAYKGERKPLVISGINNPVPISQGMFTADRFYVAGILGRDSNTGIVPEKPEDQLKMVEKRLDNALKSAKMSAKSMVFANIYHTSKVDPAPLKEKMGRAALAVIEVPALPFGANVSITGVAARKPFVQEGPCNWIGDTGFCSLMTEMKYLATPVATNLYIDSIDEFAAMNAEYAKAFAGRPLPSRTTVQPVKVGAAPHKFRSSYIAVR